MKFSLILPTRKRVNNLKRLFNSIEETISGDHEIVISMWIDDDDDETIHYIEEEWDQKSFHFNIDHVIKERDKNFGVMYNFLWERTNADIYQMVNDDIIYETDDWDKEIVKEINKFDDKIIFVWGNNADNGFPNHFFTTDIVTEVLGYFCWRDTPGWYTEKWIYYIFKQLKSRFNEDRLIYREDIRIPHLSPEHTDTKPDEVWREAPKKTPHIVNTFRKRENERITKARELKEYIQSKRND